MKQGIKQAEKGENEGTVGNMLHILDKKEKQISNFGR